MATVKLAKPKNPRKRVIDVDALLAKVPAGPKKPSQANAKKAIDESEIVVGERLAQVLKRRGLKAR
jgi:hypothetical protein